MAKAATAARAVGAALAADAKSKLATLKGSAGASNAARDKIVSLALDRKLKLQRSRPLTGYQLFMKDRLPERPAGMNVTQFMKECGSEWTSLSAAAKEKYLTKAKEAKETAANAPPAPVNSSTEKGFSGGQINLRSDMAVSKASSAVTEAVLKGFFAEVQLAASGLESGAAQKMKLKGIGSLEIKKLDQGSGLQITFKPKELIKATGA
jgi:hypothetical protein